jgi:hypothetical protein
MLRVELHLSESLVDPVGQNELPDLPSHHAAKGVASSSGITWFSLEKDPSR